MGKLYRFPYKLIVIHVGPVLSGIRAKSFTFHHLRAVALRPARRMKKQDGGLPFDSAHQSPEMA